MFLDTAALELYYDSMLVIQYVFYFTIHAPTWNVGVKVCTYSSKIILSLNISNQLHIICQISIKSYKNLFISTFTQKIAPFTHPFLPTYFSSIDKTLFHFIISRFTTVFFSFFLASLSPNFLSLLLPLSLQYDPSREETGNLILGIKTCENNTSLCSSSREIPLFSLCAYIHT